jgi:hypothetical protein
LQSSALRQRCFSIASAKLELFRITTKSFGNKNVLYNIFSEIGGISHLYIIRESPSQQLASSLTPHFRKAHFCQKKPCCATPPQKKHAKKLPLSCIFLLNATQQPSTTLASSLPLLPLPYDFLHEKPLSLAKKLSGRCIFYLIFT